MKKPTGFSAARVRRVEDRDAVAEHVADVDVAAVDHHLHAVGPAANVAVGEVPDATADALGRDRLVLRQCRQRHGGGRGNPKQALQMRAARDHGRSPPMSFFATARGGEPAPAKGMRQAQGGLSEPTRHPGRDACIAIRDLRKLALPCRRSRIVSPRPAPGLGFRDDGSRPGRVGGLVPVDIAAARTM